MGKDLIGNFKPKKCQSRYLCQTQLTSKQKPSIEFHFLIIKGNSLVVIESHMSNNTTLKFIKQKMSEETHIRLY